MTQTAVSARDVVGIADRFGLGNVHRWQRLKAGTINTNISVESDAGRFFIRVNEGKSDADVDYEIALLEALERAGVAAAAPLRGARGERYGRHQGKQVVVFRWLAGEHREGAALKASDLFSLGGALAALHQATSALGPTYERTSIYSTAAIGQRVAAIEAGADNELAEVVADLEAELEWLAERWPARDALPRAVIHGDLFPDNVLFVDDAVAALIDFEQASSGAPVYELAVCLNAWCVEDELRGDHARALLAGYRRARALPELDAATLWVECRAAALRFTATRITDVHLAGLTRVGKDYRDFHRRLLGWRRGGVAVLEALL